MLKLATKISFKNLILFRKIAFTPPQVISQALRCGLR